MKKLRTFQANLGKLEQRLQNKRSRLNDFQYIEKPIFGIKNFDVKNSETADWVTNAFQDLFNRTQGKVKFAKNVKVKNLENEKGIMMYDKKSDTLYFQKWYLDMIEENAAKSKMTVSQYMDYLSKNHPTLSKMDGTAGYAKSSYHNIQHELAHKMHSRIYKNYNSPKALQDWLKDENALETAGKVSEYAKSSPEEFVAEVFPLLAHKVPVSEDILQLYIKHEGPLAREFSQLLTKSSKGLLNGQMAESVKDMIAKMSQDGQITELSFADYFPVKSKKLQESTNIEVLV